MGLNTVLLILNDHLHRIEQTPEFGAKVSRAIQSSGRLPITGQTQVISISHADDYQIVVVRGGIGKEVSGELPPAIRRRVEDAFRVVTRSSGGERAKEERD